MTAAVENLADEEPWSDVLMETPHVTGIEAMAQGLVTLRVTAQVRANERDGVQREIRRRLKAAFDANDVQHAGALHGPDRLTGSGSLGPGRATSTGFVEFLGGIVPVAGFGGVVR